jgi:nitroreductase
MDSFYQLVCTRQSDRAFLPTGIEEEKINRILEAAQLAPSACNAQPWHFVVVNETEKRLQIADAMASKVLAMNHFTKQAPLQLVVVEEKANISSSFGSWAKNKYFPHIDIGIVASHICLAAADEGLGTCMIGWFDEKKIKNILSIPDEKRVLLVIVMGYSAQKTRTKKRKKLNDIVSYNSYKK